MMEELEKEEATWRLVYKAMVDAETARRSVWVDMAALRVAMDEIVKAKVVASERLTEAEKRFEKVEATWRLAFKAMVDVERLSTRWI